MPPPVMSTMGVGRGIVFPNDSVWRYQPPATSEMIELWKGNSGLVAPPPMMRTGIYALEADGSVWEYAPTAAGGLNELFNGQYTPNITGISPSSGPAGTSVTITGANFTGATAVAFGPTNATSFVVNSDSSITAVSPAVTGVAAITVTTPAGTSIAGAPSQFTGLITPTTWNPADKSASVTLTNSNLTATAGAAGGIRAVASKSTGKFYFEYNCVNTAANEAIGIATSTANLTSGVTSAAIMITSNQIWVNGSNTGIGGTGWSTGDTICVAADLPNSLIWFRNSGGIWNGNAANNPVTGIGGVSFSVLAKPLFPYLAMSGGSSSYIANFGATAFSGAVPSGFAAGWG